MADIRNTAVIGSGSWGTAAATLLRRNSHNVTLWSRNPEKSENLRNTLENTEYLPGVKLDAEIEFTSDISCISGKELIVLVTPSATIRQMCRTMAPYITPGQIIVILSKGLEEGTHMTMSEIAAQECPMAKITVMSGPSHAEEASRGIPTLNVVASNDANAAKTVQDIFMSEVFRIYTSSDILGVELGGAIKNVIALCAGIIDGIGFGDNTKAALMTRGIREIARLGSAMGAESETFWGLSGIGDLIVTCTSMHSRNRRAGILIGQGKSLEETLSEIHMVVEGINTTCAAKELADKLGVEMPIVNAAYEVLYNGLSPRDAVTTLMIRTKKDEIV
ncbi:MAG: NAD(P)H-dependent glycerol-3-phosphate dehydrogenase [Clostridia bacterium]|nr:NAD(P)H-dependent glycerol-3-phosphate dehydrogenase [Clostridia bacterium]